MKRHPELGETLRHIRNTLIPEIYIPKCEQLGIPLCRSTKTESYIFRNPLIHYESDHTRCRGSFIKVGTYNSKKDPVVYFVIEPSLINHPTRLVYVCASKRIPGVEDFEFHCTDPDITFGFFVKYATLANATLKLTPDTNTDGFYKIKTKVGTFVWNKADHEFYSLGLVKEPNPKLIYKTLLPSGLVHNSEKETLGNEKLAELFYTTHKNNLEKIDITGIKR